MMCFVRNLMILLSCSLFLHCSRPPKKAIFLKPELSLSSIDEIVLLPTLDMRLDKKVKVKLERQIRQKASRVIERKGFPVELTDAVEYMGQITEADLKSGDPAMIRELGTTESRWIMVLVLVDVSTKLTFGSTGSAEIDGYLFDKKTESIVWRDKGIARVGQVSLIGMAMKGVMDNEAIGAALIDLLSSLPNRKSAKSTRTISD